MTEAVDDYEQVSIYPLDDDDREALLKTHAECSFVWSTRDGHPLGVIMSYLWHDGRFWLTAGAHRHRISAVRRDPRVSVVITSTGTKIGGGKSITAKGRCVVHEDPETKEWFYPAFADLLDDLVFFHDVTDQRSSSVHSGTRLLHLWLDCTIRRILRPIIRVVRTLGSRS